MGSKIKVVPTSRIGIGPLADMAEHMRSFLPGWEDTNPSVDKSREPSDLRLDLEHLARHDAEGVLVASLGSEVVGFVTSFVRSRWLFISQLWVLPEYRDAGTAEILLRRAFLFGERSGATKAALAAWTPSDLAIGLGFGLNPIFPCLRLLLPTEKALLLGQQLAKLRPGAEVTAETVGRRAYLADLERLDRLVRGVSRSLDHEYWLFSRNLQLAVVKESDRVMAYAYGGPEQCGPVVGATEEASLAALGWALQLAARSAEKKGDGGTVSFLLPTTFVKAFDHLLEVKPQVPAVCSWLANGSLRTGYFLFSSFSLL